MSEKEKLSSERQLCGRKCLVDVRGQRRMGRLVRDDRKTTVTQITTRYNHGMQNTSLNTQHIESWSRWTTAAEDHTGCLSCQLRTGNGDYNSHKFTKIGQQKIGKTLPGLMSLDFCCDIQMVVSVFGIKNWKHGSILPCLNGSSWCWCNGVGDIFLAHLVPIEHCLNATAYLSIVADHVHPFMTTVYPSSDVYFQQYNAPCHKAQIISDWFLEHDNEFTLLKWPPQSPDLNLMEHLWDVVEWESHIMDVQPTNQQQLRDAIMSIWTKISEECLWGTPCWIYATKN